MGGTPSASPDPAGSPDGQPQDGQPQYGQSRYGQSRYGQSRYGQSRYGQSRYGQSRYGQSRYAQPQDRRTPDEENAGWTIFSYLIAGMVAYGLVGWLVAWLTHIPVLLPLGALLGLVIAIGGVVWKYGRHE